MTLASVLLRNRRLSRLVALRTLAVSFALSGCVPATAYEQAQSSASVEREGHRRTALELEASKEEMRREKSRRESLEKQLAALKKELDEGENALAQASLEKENNAKAKEHQAELVTQLRGELARVGTHLESYESDKFALEKKLENAETQLRTKREAIALLEAQLEELGKKEKSSQASQKKLSEKLDELASLQKKSEAADSQADRAARDEPTPEVSESPTEAQPSPDQE